ncbi:magnesium/cobalt transporter CorA [Bacillus taeanensis]|uniref:Magnesium transport protein CorA n=1 Tax=Bacillus taeanensis TaxID=273032 RepID=A0A366XXX1_9BACI|nr:magnesium/cobalt transporter CorA [Bacillus taeanensis]RBW69995.1 magnesium and cobalt transport protein CorA [Bacillus taeanensis]
MNKVRKKRRSSREKKQGMPPGSFVYIGEEKEEPVKISVIDYDKDYYEEKELAHPSEILLYKEKETVTWINVSGIHNEKLIEEIGKKFNLHSLLIEDILNSEHRPKISFYEDHILAIMKRLSFSETKHTMEDEQISFLLGKNILITFQETLEDDFDGIRKEIKQKINGIRKQRADYLMYRLMDTLVDRYLIEVEQMNDNIEILEEEMVMNPLQDDLHMIYEYKHQAIELRKLVWPVRDVINKLEKRPLSLIQKETQFFFSDVNDHIIQVNDMIETTRGVVSSLLDLHFSSVSNKMNEVMKVLTIVSTIFIPLTFIAGIYGMNFVYMPELQWKWSYPIALFVMVIITIGMLVFFRKKNWF